MSLVLLSGSNSVRLSDVQGSCFMSKRFRQPMLHLAVLAMFVMSGSGLFPSLLGALAKLDGEHSVGITREVGATVIVLGHVRSGENPVATANASHRHSGLADFVLAFGASQGCNSDHLIAFSHSDFSRESDDSRIVVSEPVLRIVDLPAPVVRAVAHSSVRSLSPSPAATARLRTIVLQV